ncbi:uncharacterized protein LOC126837640 isoform X2 [Adelges cooleyi]|uniref:uncharacterized protein LOC126837640 isoform X2 n=1 Tax=Adelges cooleyi TaxID=133065 RepID=UPI0021809133|nr:uncharacterized protein LOC126837640 isoform X2 [Adelges cooleyi]
MKLLGILISFALVGNVLVTKLEEYMKEVILTNKEIKQAKELMPAIIKNVIENYQVYGIAKMSLMMAVPEAIDVALEAKEVYPDSDENENPVSVGPSQNQIPLIDLDPDSEEGPSQNRIPFINLDPDFEEGPGQNQIPLIDLDPDSEEENIDGNTKGAGPSQYQIPDLNLDPFTVPEEEIKKLVPVGKTIVHLKQKLKYQKMVQLEILAVTDRRKYEQIMEAARKKKLTSEHVPIQSLNLNRPADYFEKRRMEIPTMKLENLVSVLEERRINPIAAPRNRIIHAYGLPYLGRVRREITLEAITNLIRQNDPLFWDLYMMCRLAGLFRSIKYPQSFIYTLLVDEDHCFLSDANDVEGFAYKFIEDEFWQVDVKDLDSRIRPFLSELK